LRSCASTAKWRCAAAWRCARPAAHCASWNRWRARWPAARAWVTGLRREQSGTRAEVPFRDIDDTGRHKFNPLADWSWHDVWHYIDLHQVPFNPCTTNTIQASAANPAHAPLRRARTSAPAAGGGKSKDAKECGLHVRHASRQGDRGMNAPANLGQLLPGLDHEHLDALEEEAIFILREVAASFERPALLFSGGKDSCVVLRLAEKAFKRHQGGQTSPAACPSPCCTWTPDTTFRK
jgi:sulfate adenylyltransferase subunit 2